MGETQEGEKARRTQGRGRSVPRPIRSTFPFTHPLTHLPTYLAQQGGQSCSLPTPPRPAKPMEAALRAWRRLPRGPRLPPTAAPQASGCPSSGLFSRL